MSASRVKRPRLKRSELWASCVSRPKARSTYEGSADAELQAEPVEIASSPSPATKLSPKKQPPDEQQHRQHERQSVFEDVSQEGRCPDFLMIGDGFNHEVGAVADVRICAEKDRANAALAHPTMAEGLSMLFSNTPPRSVQQITPERAA